MRSVAAHTLGLTYLPPKMPYKADKTQQLHAESVCGATDLS